MDVEIVKQNGQSFRLSDYGVVQDFVVHSIDRSVVREPIDGSSGLQDYGVEIGDRTIEVPMIFKAADLHDYAHLRDELYGLLDDSEPFYIREMRRPKALQYDFVDFGQKPKWESQTDNEYVNGKQYRVRLNSTLTPDQRSLSGEVSIEFVTSGIPYAESVYTTLELHNTGFDAVEEKYGLVDGIDTDKINYRYKPTLKANMIPLTQDSWEDGGYSTSTGDVYNNSARLRLKRDRAIKVVKGETYTIYDESLNTSAIDTINIFQYENGEYLGTSNWIQFNRMGEITIVAEGNEVLIAFNPASGFNVPVSHINHPEERIKIKMEQGETFTGFANETESFNIYNAGNVTVEPESMYLQITIGLVTTDNVFRLKNITTGETFEYRKAVSSRNIYIRGLVVSEGTAIPNAFRDTNRRFISLAPGDNEFEVSGGTFSQITFDFKYHYK